jgi:hypothetical protein
MKKILIASILSASFFTVSASSSELGLDMLGGLSGTSGLSVLSIVISPLLSSAAVGSLFQDLSRSSQPIRVTKIEQRNDNRTYIYGVANDKPVEFEAPTKVVKEAKLQNGGQINVKNAKMGYVLESNNVALGIVPASNNSNDFKQNKLN